MADGVCSRSVSMPILSARSIKGPVKLRPRASCQRHDAHVVIGHHQSVCQHLQGIEGGIDHDVGFRQFPRMVLAKPKNRGSPEAKTIDLSPPRGGERQILVEDLLSGAVMSIHSASWRQRSHDVVVALATGEHLPRLDDAQHLRREEGLRSVGYADDNELILIQSSIFNL